MRTFAITTLGCKVNQYESAQFHAALERLGMTPAADGQAPDLCLVHTCAVTTEAMRKSRQAVRHAGGNPATAVVVTGCWATAHPDQAQQLHGVGLVIPNRHDRQAVDRLAGFVDAQRRRTATLPGHADNAPVAAGLGHVGDEVIMRPDSNPLQGHGQRPATSTNVNIHPPAGTVKDKLDSQPASLLSLSVVSAAHPNPVACDGDAVNDPCDDDTRLALPPLQQFSGRSRAFVKIQDGCDAFCTFCIIPKLRPALHSRPVGEVVDEVRSLVAHGHREVVLTGIFMGAFGRPTALRRRWDADARQPLVELVSAVSRVPGLARLRLSSLEPGDLTPELLDVLADAENCVPHFHLPLQAGSDAILKRMNRQYRRADFEQMVAMVHDRLDRPAISTDIIVGFPGETDADFAETLAVARASRFVKIHAFRFSPRPGTAAARWQKDFVHGQTARDRVAELGRLETDLSLAYRRRFEGETVRVLVETPDPQAPQIARGRADRYFMVHFETAGIRGQGSGIRETALTAGIRDQALGIRETASTRDGVAANRPSPVACDGDAANPRVPVSPRPRVTPGVEPGSLATVRITRVTPTRTHGQLISIDG